MMSTAITETNRLIELYRAAVNPGQREKEAPLLAAASAREASAAMLVAVDVLGADLVSW